LVAVWVEVGEVNCGRSCSWTGDFTSDDGTDTRYGVGLGSGGNVHRVGDQVPALDTGDRVNVYPLGGGNDWIFLSAITLVAVVLLVARRLAASAWSGSGTTSTAGGHPG
jgi:hypothetical protein